MLDIHCHILPGLDDGAFVEEDTLQMAQLAEANNTRLIICTPHNGQYSRDFLISVFRRTAALLKQNNIKLRLLLGQEIYVSENYNKQIDEIEHNTLLTLNNSVYPLIEFSPYERIDTVLSSVGELKARGYVPIIAHPERYAFVAEDYSILRQLREQGAFLQINKDSLKGMFGAEARKISHRLLDEREADFVASDAHSPYVRTPTLRGVHEYISEQYSMDYADYLMKANPAKIIKNEKAYHY